MVKTSGVNSPPSFGPTWPIGLFQAGILAWASVLFLASLIIRAIEAANSPFYPDEFYYLHSAWMLGHGYLPYRDFWADHTPLFIYFLRPLVLYYNENLAIFPVVRLLIFVVNLGLFVLVALLAARRQPWTAGLFACLLLALNPTVFRATVAIRHDSLTLICELLALSVLARGIRSRRSSDVLVAGTLLGLALAMSPKGLFGLSGLLLGCIVHHLSSSCRSEHRLGLLWQTRLLGLLLLGAMGTLGLVLVYLLPLGVWPLLLKRVVLESLTSPDRFSPLTRYLLRDIRAEPIAWLIMLGGFVEAGRQWWVGRVRQDPCETLLLVAGLWFGVVYLFLMSSRWPQSALPFIAILSIFGGRLLAKGNAQLSGVTSKGKAIAWAVCITSIVGWIAIGSAWTIYARGSPFLQRNREQVRAIQYVLTLTGPEDVVFDGQSAYIFRPQASYYGSLTEAIRIRIRRGDLRFDIPERCQKLGCKVVIEDNRIRGLPEHVQAWLRDNYLPSPLFPHVHLHRSLGSEATSPGGHGSKLSP